MPQRQSTNTIPTPELQGDDSWIRIIHITVGQHNRILAARRRLVGQEDEDSEALNLLVQEVERETATVIAECVLGWNWVDDEGEPLPQPHNNPEVFERLTMRELEFISTQIYAEKKEEKSKKPDKRS